MTTNYVSSATEVAHYIHFTDADEAYLTKNATSVITYWFVNCIYYGASSDLSFHYNYTKSEKTNVEALVVAGFEPLPPPPTTTTPAPTTTTTTTTTSAPPHNTTTTTTTTTTVKPTTTPTTLAPSSNVTSQLAIIHPDLKLGSNVSQIPILPYVCLNTSMIAPDPKKLYGYFSKEISVKGLCLK